MQAEIGKVLHSGAIANEIYFRTVDTCKNSKDERTGALG